MKHLCINPAIPIALFLGFAVAASTARADTFGFSITNTVGDVAGTVYGNIYGLVDNSTSSATDVLIIGYPPALDSIYGTGAIDVSLWDQQYENSFTETNGVITSGGFWAQNYNGPLSYGSQLYINGYSSYNFVNIDGEDVHYVWGNNGFGTISFGLPYSVPNGRPPIPPIVTPEPTSLILVATGLAGAVASRRRKIIL